MNKVKKILDIADERPEGARDAVSVQLFDIRHTKVHSHRSSLIFEAVMCLEGKLGIYCNEDNGFLYPGDIFVINYDDLHCLYSDEENTTLIMQFDLQKLHVDPELFQLPYLTCDDMACKPFQRGFMVAIKCAVLSLAYNMIVKKIPEEESSKQANDIIAYLSTHFDWLNNRDSYINYNEELNERLRTVLSYCTEHYKQKLTASKLAESVHINSSYFSQFFKKSPFGGFNKMLGYIRCMNAQKLLIGSEMTITEISIECGFSDEKYFYKNFRNFWHKTPSEYRAWFSEYVKTEYDVRTIDEERIESTMTSHAAEFLSGMFFNERLLDDEDW